ncbi:MAG: hypothetical protein FWE34_08490 [Defluviitaleaceae bacterium]|nr:hypothetical protein [Defluviitaleaceae bacterium]
MDDEAQNMLILGNLIIGNESKESFGWRDTTNWVMATVTDGDELCLCRSNDTAIWLDYVRC